MKNIVTSVNQCPVLLSVFDTKMLKSVLFVRIQFSPLEMPMHPSRNTMITNIFYVCGCQLLALYVPVLPVDYPDNPISRCHASCRFNILPVIISVA